VIEYARKNPLLFIIIVALILRLFAVIFSKGFMANDDYFETVQIAYEGVQSGLLNQDGHLKWNTVKPINIGRSPLYVLFNYSLMEILEFMGIKTLDSMMYFIRLVHALLSLLFVYYGSKYILKATGSTAYTLFGGLLLAGHFLMPYLSVRNLIETVSADFLIPCLFFAWAGMKEKNSRLIILAGIFGALSWTIRVNTVAAVAPIPFVLWYYSKNFRPFLYFAGGALVIFLFAASLDLIFLGRFGQVMINVAGRALQNLNHPPLPQPFYMFALLFLGIFIPPFSLFFLGSIFQKKIIREHLIPFSSAAVFFLLHSAIAHKEERFMIPIMPVVIVLGSIGLYYFLKNKNIKPALHRIFKYSLWFAIIVNIAALPIFTLNYGHKGMVEPFVYISKQQNVDGLILDRAERKRYLAIGYAGYKKPEHYKINNWPDFEVVSGIDAAQEANYFIVWSEGQLERHVDSIVAHWGPVEEVFHSTPSMVDAILNYLNPKYNDRNEAWVFRKVINNPGNEIHPADDG